MEEEARNEIKSCVISLELAKSKIEILQAARNGAVDEMTFNGFGDVCRLVFDELTEDLDSAIEDIKKATGTPAEGEVSHE